MNIIAFGIIISSLVFMVLILINPAYNLFSSNIIDASLASNFGSLIGGVLSPLLTIISVLLIIETINNQKKDRNIDQLRSHVYELIKYNREIVSEFEYVESNDADGTIKRGSRFFIFAKRQIEEIFNLISQLIPEYEIIKRVNIAYLIFYYGCGYENIAILKDEIEELTNTIKSNLIVSTLRNKKTSYDEDVCFYGGHQSRLAHYFRQLYFISKLIDENNNITDKEKKEFMKIVRVQMGNYEQAIFFYNSLSSIGNAWCVIGKDKKSLIERYELVKNIPRHFTSAIEVKEVYPNMKYELT